MKRFKLFFVLIVLIQVAPLQAQRLGDGRFLRRMLGLEPPASVEESAEQRLEASRKESALRQDAQPTQPAAGQSPTTRPTLSTQQSTRRFSQRYPSPPSPSLSPSAQRLPRPPAKPTAAAPPVAAQRESQRYRPFQQTKPVRALDHEGFGITLKTNGKKVIVTKVDPKGTAAKVGIQQGDIVKSIASLPISNPAEVKQFADVLQPGDQVEFEIIRRGKESKVLVSFIRVAHPDSAPQLASRQDDKTSFLLPAPTEPAARSPSQGRLSSGERTEVEELREVVERQKQVIADLQKRLDAVERSSRGKRPSLSFPQ